MARARRSGDNPRGLAGRRREEFELLCYRCGSHVQDGADKCWNCATPLASVNKTPGASLEELRERQRTKSRLSAVVYKIGDVVANRYQIRDIVGSGGAGVVY